MSTPSTLSQLSDELAALAEKAGQSVVLVNARRRQPASGVVYAHGLVLTADHVIQREENIAVELPGGEQLSALLAGRDPTRDLALLRLEKAAGQPALPFRASPKPGSLTLAIARPDSGGLQASLGMIMSVSGPIRRGHSALFDSIIRASVTPYPGFSGGALVDMHGNLLGLNTSGIAMGLLLTIPAAAAWETAAMLEAHGRVRRAYLGVRSQPVPLAPAQQIALGRPQAAALLLVGVEPESPAQKAGLLIGDLLTSLDGKFLIDPEDLQIALSGDRVGAEGLLEILRGEQRLERKVLLGERT
ncbi:MAG: PDZ domain-containing protein [Anaerolineae bacterium]|nr:PDZ domain-containing protein [Anaerolineae bacterium]